MVKQRFFLTHHPVWVFIITISLIGYILAEYAPAACAQVAPDTVSLSRSELEALINREGTTAHAGDLAIARGQTVKGPLVVYDGNAFVSGAVDGDLMVVNGSVSLHRAAVVSGDVLVVRGWIYASNSATIHGRQTTLDDAYIVEKTRSGRLRLRPDRSPAIALKAAPSGWRYTRVRGHDFELTLGLIPRDPVWYPRLTGVVSLPTVENNHGFLDFSAAFEEPLFERNTLRLRVEAYKKTDTNDAWSVHPVVNSLAGFFTKNDFYNHFVRRGWSASATQNVSRDFSLSLAYRHDTFRNLGTRDPFALFGGDRAFRVNPAIDEGDIRSLVWRATYDAGLDGKARGNAWQITAELERALDAFGGDFEFTRYDLTVRRYNEWRGHHLDIRAKFAGAGSPLPLQRSYVLGALSGLRGFDDFEYAGDRMVLVNAEYRIPLATWRRESLIPWRLQLMPFFDTGTAYFSDPARNAAGHPALATRVSPRVDATTPDSYADLRSDAGVGIVLSSRILYASLHIAQNLHDSGAKSRVLVFLYRDLF